MHVIGIPTLRRPDELRILVRSLAAQITDRDAHIVIADNEPSPGTAPLVHEILPDATVVDVHKRGLAQARNALIRTAYERIPDFEWLIMLDDDGRVRPGWFEALTTAADRWDADVAGGPVIGQLPTGSSRLARNSLFAGRRRHPTGPVELLNGAQNIILRRRLLDRLPEPWFDPDLDRTGGEDYAFFRRVQRFGARMIWVDEAEVIEPTPAERLTTRAILGRVWTNNVTAAHIDRAGIGRPAAARAWARRALSVGKDTASAVVRRDPDDIARAAIACTACAAHGVGLAGGRPAAGYGD